MESLGTIFSSINRRNDDFGASYTSDYLFSLTELSFPQIYDRINVIRTELLEERLIFTKDFREQFYFFLKTCKLRNVESGRGKNRHPTHNNRAVSWFIACSFRSTWTGFVFLMNDKPVNMISDTF